MSVSAEQIAGVLGGAEALGLRVSSARDLEEVVKQGMPKQALDNLIALFETAPGTDTAVQLRNRIMPRTTYQRVARLNLQVGETTERLARLYALAKSIFEDSHAAARFMTTAHPELDGRSPFDAALTEIGGRQVEEIMQRGLHGLPA